MDNYLSSLNKIQLQVTTQLNNTASKSVSFKREMPNDAVEINSKKKHKIFSRLFSSFSSSSETKSENDNKPILTERQKQIQILKSPSLPPLSLSDTEIEEVLTDLDEQQMNKFMETYSRKIWFVEHLDSVENAQNTEKLSVKDKDKNRLNTLKDFVIKFYDENDPTLFNKAMNFVYTYNKTISETSKELGMESETLIQKEEPLIEEKPTILEDNVHEVSNKAAKEDIDSIKNQISESLHLYKPLADEADNYWAFYNYNKDLHSKTTDDFIQIFQDSIETSGKEFSQADLADVCENFIFDKSTIDNVNYGDIPTDSIDKMKIKLLYISNAFKELQSLILTIPQKDNEPSSIYLKRVVSEYSALLDNKQAEKESVIKSRLEFSESDVDENKIVLTDSEKQELADAINSWSSSNKVDKDTPMTDIAYRWKQKYISGGVFGMDSKLEDACIQEFKRYSSADDKYMKTPNQPVFRWLSVQENAEDFLNNIPNEGEIYIPQQRQSCSKLPNGAETCFHNNNSSMNVKFVIYPKAKTSKAYDIGECKYGPFEVIYPSNSQFKVLYKDIEEIKHDEKLWVPAIENNTKTGSHIQAVIYMQEV